MWNEGIQDLFPCCGVGPNEIRDPLEKSGNPGEIEAGVPFPDRFVDAGSRKREEVVKCGLILTKVALQPLRDFEIQSREDEGSVCVPQGAGQGEK